MAASMPPRPNSCRRTTAKNAESTPPEYPSRTEGKLRTSVRRDSRRAGAGRMRNTTRVLLKGQFRRLTGYSVGSMYLAHLDSVVPLANPDLRRHVLDMMLINVHP